MALIGCWHFNESTDLIAPDTSGYGNNGTLEGSMTDADWIPGISENCLDFDGINDRVDFGNNTPLDQLGNGDFSISFWMKSKDVIPLFYGSIINKAVSSVTQIDIYSNATQQRIGILIEKDSAYSLTIFNAFTNPFDTIWNHIVILANRVTDTLNLYLNNIVDPINGDLSSLPIDCSNNANLVFGAYADGSYPYEGLIDEINVYDHVLSEAEINFLFNNPNGPDETDYTYPIIAMLTETNPIAMLTETNPIAMLIETNPIGEIYEDS